MLADTAGRLHTKVNLMEELRKVRRVAERPPGKVTEVLLVIDATTGQNGLAQARQFTEAVEVTGVVLTKLDGSAKGGIVLAIQTELGHPGEAGGAGRDRRTTWSSSIPTSSSRRCSHDDRVRLKTVFGILLRPAAAFGGGDPQRSASGA